MDFMLGTNHKTKMCSTTKINDNIDVFINQATESSHNITKPTNKKNKRKIQKNKKSKRIKKSKIQSFDNGDNSDDDNSDDTDKSSISSFEKEVKKKINEPIDTENQNNLSLPNYDDSYRNNCTNFYNSYDWVDNLDDFYNQANSVNFLNLQNLNNTHNFFESTNNDEITDDDYRTDDPNDPNNSDDSGDSENSTDAEDSDSSTKSNNKFKKSKKEKSILQEEINDLKKDTINNSDSLDHLEIALETLKELRHDYPKIKVSGLINKFKKEILNYLNSLKSSPGIKMIDDLFIKYKNAFDRVYNMLKKEYNKKKEKLDIETWVTMEINKRKKLLKKQEKDDSLYPMLFTQSFPSTFVLPMSGWGGVSQPVKDQELINEFNTLYKQDSSEKSGTDYFTQLNTKEKKEYIKKLRDIKKIDGLCDNKPNMAKIIECETTDNNKSIILSKINNFENLRGSSEYYKLKNWINKIMKIPFGKYISAPVAKTDGSEKIREYLQKVRKNLDEDIYGHDVTKQQLIKILAHTIANPGEGGNIFALQGPPGIGKTALIQDGISKALGRPFTFISLGGATDACFLEGHDYTYEGSNCGRIVDLLQQASCMNPVIYFDELDKVSETAKGEEIINILMHITDVTQNSHFNDKYFGGIDFDLSKAIIIFSFNDEYKISRILRDRMKIIRIKGYKMIDKINIARDYLLPKLLKQIGLDIEIKFSDDILEYITDSYTNEGGVRKLKEILNDILLEINLRKLEDNKILGKKIKNKLIISKNMLDEDLLKKKHKIEHIHINSQPYIGQVNGLWANEYGVGGLIPIECCWIPSTDKLKLELTGMQGKVMQESMSVARTIAWKILPTKIKDCLNDKWSKSFDNGIHVHCPDGATPKDGPSAGGAITTCLISLLSEIPVNNKIAMTGEINLKGQITKIGGLEEKIFGAKKAGAQLVLCPEENLKDLEEITEKFPNLFDAQFTAKTVKNIWEILDQVLMKKLDYQKF